MKVSTILASLFLSISVTLAAPAHRNSDSNHEYDMCVSGCSDKKGGETSFEKCVEDTCGGRSRSNGQWDDDNEDSLGDEYNNDDDYDYCNEEDNENWYSAKKNSKGDKKQ